MKRTIFTLPFAAALLALTALFFHTGCETLNEDDYAGVRVSPTYASLRPGQSVTLTASGGWAYRWSVDADPMDEAFGTLSANHGESVTYTARKVPDTGIDQIVTVKVEGNIANYDGYYKPGGTNTHVTAAAEVHINHRANKPKELVVP